MIYDLQSYVSVFSMLDFRKSYIAAKLTKTKSRMDIFF